LLVHGLGKTRGITALAFLYGTKHNLIIVEPKLKGEFIKEFRELNIKDYQIIESEKDLKQLKKFNLIAYNKLWKPLNEHTKKTFAKAMRRRFQFIAVDEAHKIKAKDSEQAKAVRMLKARYKLLSTGTPIANYPRNIFSLLVFGWEMARNSILTATIIQSSRQASAGTKAATPQAPGSSRKISFQSNG